MHSSRYSDDFCRCTWSNVRTLFGVWYAKHLRWWGALLIIPGIVRDLLLRVSHQTPLLQDTMCIIPEDPVRSVCRQLRAACQQRGAGCSCEGLQQSWIAGRNGLVRADVHRGRKEEVDRDARKVRCGCACGAPRHCYRARLLRERPAQHQPSDCSGNVLHNNSPHFALGMSCITKAVSLYSDQHSRVRAAVALQLLWVSSRLHCSTPSLEH